MTPLVVVGAGGHGREVFAAATAAAAAGTADWEVLGFVDDGPLGRRETDRVARLDSVVLGTIDDLTDQAVHHVIGIGTSATRRAVADRLDGGPGWTATIVHPGAHLGPDVELAEGVVVFDRCTLTTDVRIGRHAHLNVGCAVQHDSTIGEFVQLSPGVLVNGDCRIEDDVFVGTGAVITRGCVVGAGARVGAGAVVLTDVAAGSTVLGVPARPA